MRRSGTSSWSRSAGGTRRYRTAIMEPVRRTAVTARASSPRTTRSWSPTGVVLQRPELDPYWDLRVYVDVGFAEVLRRGTARDQQWMDSAAAAEHRYRTKYIPGEQRYMDEVRPRDRAQVVVGNEDVTAPTLVIRLGRGAADGVDDSAR